MLVLLTSLCLPLLALTPAMASTSIYEFSSPEQEQVFHELTKELRCPKCQNQDIGDSDAELAKDLRDKSYEMLQQGKSKQEVIDYMAARYGNFILYKPPFMASTMILWFGPVLVILVGLFIVIRRTRTSSKTTRDMSLTDEQEAQLNELLNKDKEN
ncbi:cytochrome c-type biogenesis protein [Oceanisphaera avium]|uniref:Cytochrome c-type biogenesis protein n=1 Tax=Oceanisphaera avium TaxID=1903694 RepID=A0A1Y0D1Y8_9GAMM|nr:cystathionine gamma-synthase [Oceanisphaera avium]